MAIKQDILDIRGKVCPLPVLDTYHHLKHLQPGDTFCVLTSDPGSQRNFRAFCRQSGHEFVDIREQAGGFAIYIRKKEKRADWPDLAEQCA